MKNMDGKYTRCSKIISRPITEDSMIRLPKNQRTQKDKSRSLFASQIAVTINTEIAIKEIRVVIGFIKECEIVKSWSRLSRIVCGNKIRLI